MWETIPKIPRDEISPKEGVAGQSTFPSTRMAQHRATLAARTITLADAGIARRLSFSAKVVSSRSGRSG